MVTTRKEDEIMASQMTTPSNLKCEECSSIFPVARKRAKRKEVGHIKHVWCIKCKNETAHTVQSSEYAY